MKYHLKKVFIACIIALSFYGITGANPQITTLAQSEMQGTITIVKQGNIRIHSYMSPEKGTLVTSQIIETPNKLIIVDAQFLRSYAKEVKKYAKSLNKPIDRVIISHSHPDHWFGLEYFKDNALYSLAETKDSINNLGDKMIESKKSRLGDLILSEKVVPQHVIKEGTKIIDGVHLKFEKVKNSEADFQLLIMLKDIETIIAQDIVYNNVHLFLGNKKFDDWIGVLEKLKNKKEYKIILAGHGKPLILSDIDNMVTYLKDSKDILGNVKSSKNFKEKLITKYPSHKLPVFLDLSNKYLFKN